MRFSRAAYLLAGNSRVLSEFEHDSEFYGVLSKLEVRLRELTRTYGSFSTRRGRSEPTAHMLVRTLFVAYARLADVEIQDVKTSTADNPGSAAMQFIRPIVDFILVESGKEKTGMSAEAIARFAKRES